MDATETSRMATVLAALDPARCLTAEELATAVAEVNSKLTQKDVVRTIGRLISTGHAERAERGCYLLTETGAAALASGEAFKSGPKGKLTGILRRPKRNTMRDRLWAALRIRCKGSIPELMELAGKGDGDAKTPDNAQRYLAALAKAGIVRELSRRQAGTSITSNGFKRWHLVNDLGPDAPVVRRKGNELYDPNGQKAYDLTKGAGQ